MFDVKWRFEALRSQVIDEKGTSSDYWILRDRRYTETTE